MYGNAIPIRMTGMGTTSSLTGSSAQLRSGGKPYCSNTGRRQSWAPLFFCQGLATALLLADCDTAILAAPPLAFGPSAARRLGVVVVGGMDASLLLKDVFTLQCCW